MPLSHTTNFSQHPPDSTSSDRGSVLEGHHSRGVYLHSIKLMIYYNGESEGQREDVVHVVREKKCVCVCVCVCACVCVCVCVCDECV